MARIHIIFLVCIFSVTEGGFWDFFKKKPENSDQASVEVKKIYVEPPCEDFETFMEKQYDYLDECMPFTMDTNTGRNAHEAFVICKSLETEPYKNYQLGNAVNLVGRRKKRCGPYARVVLCQKFLAYPSLKNYFRALPQM